MGQLTVITEPTKEPITLAEAKQALSIEDNNDDARIINMIKSARYMAELFTGLKLYTQTIDRSFDDWPGSTFSLDVWPLQSIDSLNYYDTSSPSTEQTLTVNDDYYADTTTKGGRIVQINSWPTTAIRPNAVRVRMTAGYSDIDNIPEYIKDGIKAYVVYLYDMDPMTKDIAEQLLWPARTILL
jgi:uncharacterized phiE125 gp8 family phage protein